MLNPLANQSDQLIFHVARLNDATVNLRCLTDGQVTTGAVPRTLTGFTMSGHGWRLVIDASYRAVVGVAQHAATARWAQSTTYVGPVLTRTNP